MKKFFAQAAALVFVASFLFSTPLRAQNSKLFEQIGQSYVLMEFISRSEFVPDHSKAHERLLPALQKAGITLQADKNEITVASFRSSDQTTWVEIEWGKNGNEFYDRWKKGLKEMGYKTDTRNDGGGSVYLRTKTGTTNSAAGAWFFTGRNLISVGIALPFPVPDTYKELDPEKQEYVLQQYPKIYSMLMTIAETYVVPTEFIYYKAPGKTLSREQRIYGFTQFWTEVKYNFAFFDQVPDLNWDHVFIECLPLIEKDQTDAEYYKTMTRMCALLKDGHTNIYPSFGARVGSDSPPVWLTNIGGKAIVENVSTTLAAALPIGTEVVAVDGVPAQRYLEENLYPYISSSTQHIRADWAIRDMLDGKQGTEVEIAYKIPKGKEQKMKLVRNSGTQQIEWVKKQKPWKLLSFKKLPGNIAYVALNSFGYEEIVKEFESKIDSINTCKALIIDIRNNGGGSSSNGYGIIEHLTYRPFVGSAWRTRELRSAYRAWGSYRINNYRSNARRDEAFTDWDKKAIQYYKGEVWYREPGDTMTPVATKKVTVPFVVLTGHNTASAAEDFLIALDNLHMTQTIGSKTFGSTGQPITIELPDGGSARVCTKRDEYPDGRQFVGYGITPDIAVENTVDDLINGNDRVLNKALEVLQKKK
ncbi:MAG TPA: S41 family peptidase [Cyclobacteriaceae bacterium]|nr:S41 family peptidase [Cyclobacteriaceae bacterium]